MTDQPDWPGWAPPGGEGRDRDAAGARPTDADEAHAAREGEPTDQIPVPGHPPPHEQTQQLPTDPPPPPPPPVSGQPPAWPPPPTGQPVYGAGGWAPPPPRRRTGLVIGIVIGVLVLMLVGVVVLGALLFSSTSTSTSAPDPVPDGQLPPDLEDPNARGEAPEVPADDVQAQSKAVLETINASEERMLEFQQAVSEAIGQDGNVGDAAADIAQQAQDAGDDLTQLRSDLRALAGGEQDEFEGLRDIRDTYAEHMNAWIAYLDAVAGSPALAAPNAEDAAPLWREIEDTGRDFVSAVETGLPENLPPDLQDLAEFIVQRGFGGFDDGATGDVV